MADSSWLDVAAKAGELASGVAASVGVPIALFQLSRWRREQRSQGRSKAALTALGALHATCNECGIWIRMLADEAAKLAPNETHGNIKHHLQGAFDAGVTDTYAAIKEVRAAVAQAEPYLTRIESRS